MPLWQGRQRITEPIEADAWCGELLEHGEGPSHARVASCVAVPINYARYAARYEPGLDSEVARVDVVATDLRAELGRVSSAIDELHVWRAKSDDIQALFFGYLATRYQVSIEKTEGFEDTTTRGNRPDAQIWLDERGSRRILLEVERGGTVTNNHDLKDFWKCHLSPLTQHLFLVVPNSITNEAGNLRSDRAFQRCTARLSSFFASERTQVDVVTAHIFGYGPDST